MVTIVASAVVVGLDLATPTDAAAQPAPSPRLIECDVEDPELCVPAVVFPSAGPACIEGRLVQTTPAAALLGVGSTFEAGDGLTYVIVTGGPTCKFNCLDGFDANCDGTTGDLCPIELALTRVADVAACLARSTPIAAPTAAPATSQAAPASAPAAVPVPPSASQLAFTGTETTLATAGLALIATGAATTALSIRRRKRED